jgi:hypothetical protein
MLWSEVKRWAKEQGYDTLKEKGNEENGDTVQYYWSKQNNPDSSGIAKSVSKLARAIFNDITENKWVTHQEEYEANKKVEIKDNGY